MFSPWVPSELVADCFEEAEGRKECLSRQRPS